MTEAYVALGLHPRLTMESLTVAGVMLRSLREGIDYSIATGRVLAGIFAPLAGYERELMHERAGVGPRGRPTAWTAHRSTRQAHHRPGPSGAGAASRRVDL